MASEGKPSRAGRPSLRALTLAVLLFARVAPAAAEICLPSLAEAGQRLHEMPAPSVLWLELLLRQHEACWTAGEPHDRLRVFFYGNSAILGHPEPVRDTAVDHLNRIWKATGMRARAFNFGFVTAHAMKDMLIVRESLRYGPDVIVYGAIPSDFTRYIASDYMEGMPGAFNAVARFMRNSAPALLDFAAERPAGLKRTLGRYRRAFGDVERRWWHPSTWRVREVLAFAYTATATRLRALALRLGLVDPPGEPRSGRTAGSYSCEETQLRNARDYYRRWGDTNPLAYLAQLRERTGIPVVIVNWPIAHEPFEICYNSYVTNQTVTGFGNWLRAEAKRLGLPLVDLSRNLIPRDFLDTLHPNARGQRKIAGGLAPFLDPVLRRRAGEVLTPAQPH